MQALFSQFLIFWGFPQIVKADIASMNHSSGWEEGTATVNKYGDLNDAFLLHRVNFLTKFSSDF